jgi:hypothetical protein
MAADIGRIQIEAWDAATPPASFSAQPFDRPANPITGSQRLDVRRRYINSGFFTVQYGPRK